MPNWNLEERTSRVDELIFQQALEAGMPFEQIERMGAQTGALEIMAGMAAAGEPQGAELTATTMAETLSPLIDWLGGVPREDMPPPRPGFVAEWLGMQFRSKTERRIAEALERAHVAFIPNARGRFGVTTDHRESREPDFLVIDGGKLGILEVDGDVAHPPGSAANDHARDRLFKQHGIRVVERFPATECWEEADRVVAEFRLLLRLNG
jgi:very-short-patch-repair endonuclease